MCVRVNQRIMSSTNYSRDVVLSNSIWRKKIFNQNLKLKIKICKTNLYYIFIKMGKVIHGGKKKLPTLTKTEIMETYVKSFFLIANLFI